LGFAAYFVGAITYTTPAATAAQTIGWKYNLVFVCCNVVTTIIIYFYIPETSGKSLEEIGELFGDEVVVHLTQDGHGIIEGDKVAHASVALEGEKTSVVHAESMRTPTP
jgi:hypothetical protein